MSRTASTPVGHNKATFLKEYCMVRGVPLRFTHAGIEIDGCHFAINENMLTFHDLLDFIDNHVEYDADTTLYKRCICEP